MKLQNLAWSQVPKSRMKKKMTGEFQSKENQVYQVWPLRQVMDGSFVTEKNI